MPSSSGPLPHLGTRLRRLRRSRGLSLDVVAGLAGISKPYLSRLEREERTLDSLDLLHRLAVALDVSLADLTGSPPIDAARHAARARASVDAWPRDVAADLLAARQALARLRAVVRTDALIAGEPRGDNPPDPQQLAAAVNDLLGKVRECDLPGQAQLLPGLVEGAMSAAHRGRLDGLPALGWAWYATTMAARSLGDPALAAAAAHHLAGIAETLDDPTWTALSQYVKTHAQLAAGERWPDGSLPVVPTGSGTRQARVASGACLLAAAGAAAQAGDDGTATALLDEAEALALGLNRGRGDVPGDAALTAMVEAFTGFSRWNVAMHRVAVHLRASRPEQALTAASTLATGTVPAAERLSYFWVDVSRAHTMLGHRPAATHALLQAERTAPLRTRLASAVDDVLTELLAGGRTDKQLRAFAARCGHPT